MRKTQIQGVAVALFAALSVFALSAGGHPIIAGWVAVASLGVLFVQGAATVSGREPDEAFERRNEARSLQSSGEDKATIPPLDGQSGQD